MVLSGRLDRVRELLRIGGAFVRLDAIEDLNYPLSMGLRYLGMVAPLLIQFFVARLVPEGQSGRLGSDYFTFAVVGIAVATVLQFALRAFGMRLQFAQNRGILETLLVEPVPWTFVPLAMNAWHFLVAGSGGVLVVAIGVALGAKLAVDGVLTFVVVLVLGGVATVAIGILSASVLVLAKRAQPVVTLYGLVASLLGGALFPLDLLPTWLRVFSYLVPHSWTITASRQALMVNPPASATSITEAIVVLLVFDVVATYVGVRLFAASLYYARGSGNLGSY